MTVRLSVETRGVTHTYQSSRSVVTFGRARSSTIFIDDPALSRTHCQIEEEDGYHFVRDLNSRNGTRLNGEKITRAAVDDGDQIAIGNTTITFFLAEADAAVPKDHAVTASWTAQLFSGDKRRRRNRRLAEDNDKEIRRLHHLLAINKRIATELEPERVLSLILDSAVDLVDAERGFLIVEQDDQIGVPVARDFWRKDIAAPTFEVSRSIALEVMRRGEPLIADDASDDERFDETVSVHGLKIRSVLCLPLRVKGQVIGALYLDNRFTRGTFTDQDAALIEAFVDQAAITLWHSDRFARSRQDGEKLKKEASEAARALDLARAQLEQLERQSGLAHDWSDIVGRSEAMRRCLSFAGRVTDSDLPVLLVGESGVGKELIARRIHANGPRCGSPFVTVDGARLSSDALQAELFGVAGDGPGAEPRRRGLFESASGGTVFLDHVDDIDIEDQKRLLRFLEAGEFRRLGADEVTKVDVRIISATQQDLEDLSAQGRFRGDLYFRLKGIRIDVPPLRERLEDIPLLIQHWLGQRKKSLDFAPKAIKLLSSYSWPGNVRELHNELERLAAVTEGTVAARDLAPHIALAEGSSDVLPGGLKSYVERIEKDILVRVLATCQGNKSRAAQVLGLSRLGLRKKMARYGLSEGGEE